MQEVLAKFKAVEKSLKAQPWFKKDKWIVSVHEFPTAKPEFITFHVFKRHWFNEDKHKLAPLNVDEF